MAGVAPQQRGSNATTIGMVVSIIVAVLLLAALIWMFTQQETLRRTAQDEQGLRAKLATAADESAARQMFPDATGSGKTLIGEMNKGIQMLCGRLTGNQTDAPKAAVEKLDAALKSIAEASKIPDREQLTSANGAASIIDTLTQLVVKERENSEKAEKELTAALQNLDALTKANTELGQNFQAQLTKMEKSVEALQAGKTEIEKTKGGEIEAFKQQIGEKQDQLDAMRRDQAKLREVARAELEKRDQKIAEQKGALQDLRGPAAQGAQELALARKPVGAVLRALPGDSLVHIDLGRQDNVTLGMTFAVYSVNAQVPSDGRGKANIEVVSLGEKTAECRVVTRPSPDDPILDGDPVGNIILSRNKAKKPQFCIVGDFDVDYDGSPDVRGREVMKALVKRYGGEVVDSVTAATDYVVVGVEPEGGKGEVPAAEQLIAKEPAKAKGEGADEEEKAPKAVKKEADKKKVTGKEEDEDKPADEADNEEPADEDKAAAEDEEAEEKSADKAKAKAQDEAEEEPADDEEAADKAPGGKPEAEKAGAKEEKPKAGATPLEIKRPGAIDPAAGPREHKAANERERYYEAIRRGEMFSIPRLPQDRFLNFVGIEPGPGAARRLQP